MPRAATESDRALRPDLEGEKLDAGFVEEAGDAGDCLDEFQVIEGRQPSFDHP